MYRDYKARTEEMALQKKLKLVMFLSSVREGRMASRISKFIQAELKSDYDVTVFDPQELALPLLEKPLHFYQDQTQAPKVLLDCEDKLKSADAFLLVTAEYNRSIPPALSNLLDHFSPSVYSYKPSGIVSYSLGPLGGVSAAMQLRCLLAELGSLSTSKIVSIPEVNKAIDEEGKVQNERVVGSFKRLMTELDWYAQCMKNHRDKVGVPK